MPTRGRLRPGLLPRLAACAALFAASGALITAATADNAPMIQPDSRQIYVSSSRGSDSNDGLTAATPKASLAAAAALMRDGYPDWMLLRRGDEWSEGLAGFAFDGRSASEPAAIVAYGSGNSLPRINPSDPSAAWPSGNHVVPFNVDLPKLSVDIDSLPALDANGDGVVSTDELVAYDVSAAMAVAQSPFRYTDLVPHADSRVYYVSSSSGNDNNDGLSEERPFRSINKAYESLRDGHPDWILLKRGDTWFESWLRWRKNGRSEDAPMVVAAYGDSPERPKLLTGSSHALVVGWGPKSHLVFSGFEAHPHTRGSSAPTGLRLLSGGDDVLIEDVHIHGYQDNIIIQDLDGPWKSVRVRGSVIVDSFSSNGGHSQGIYAAGVETLTLDGNVFDHNGWNADLGADATIFNHNVYIQKDCGPAVVVRNVFARASATGVQVRPGGIVLGNTVIENPLGISIGHAQLGPMNKTAGGIVVGNVVWGTRNISDGARGMGITYAVADGLLISRNAVVENTFGTGNIIGIGWTDRASRRVALIENIVADWESPIATGTGILLAQLSESVVKRNFVRTASPLAVAVDISSSASTNSIEMNGGGYDGHLGPRFSISGARLSFAEWIDRGVETDPELMNGAISTHHLSLGSFTGTTVEVAAANYLSEARQLSRVRPEFADAMHRYRNFVLETSSMNR